MKKHLLLLFLMALLPLVANAYHAYIDGIYYNFFGNEATVTSTGPESDSYSGTVVVPEFVNYKSKTFRVTDIDGIAFFNCSNLTSVTIPGSVKCIGNNVFAHCNLTYVTISNGVTSIGDYAFRDCNSLTSITIPNSVTSIGEGAFSRCNGLTSITIPNSVTSIGNEAFEYCENLISISIPENVTSIGDYAFNGTAWYQNLYDNHPDGILYLGKVALGYKGTMPEGTHITIKEGTTKIAGHAFAFNNNLTSITIPNSVTSIGNSAFSYCSNLSSITIPNSVIDIGRDAFYNTTWYNNLPDGIVYVGKVAYKYKGTMPEGTQIVIKDGTTEIAESAFNYCKGLTSVSIPNSVTNIGERSFYGCNALTSVTIPNSVTSIGSSAFSGCSGLTSVTIPNSVTSIGSSAFDDCSGLTAVFINDLSAWCKIPFISGYSNPLFYAHHLYLKGQEVKSLVIPDGMTNIGDYAFSGCTGLTSVTIPNSVTSIGNYTFSGCSNLTSVSIPNGVTYIGESAFYKCSGLISVTIPESVLGINRGTFNDCSSLTSITIPECLTKIYNYAFEGTAWYNNQPDGVLYIGKVLYGYKGNMPSGTQITIKEGTLGIADYAFGNQYYNNLTSITFPKSLISIGDEAFYNCRALTSIIIPESVLEIGSSAFRWCNNLTSINIPESVTNIKSKTFQGCNITSVTIPKGVTNIDYYAFQGCKCLTSVTSNIQNPFETGSSAFEGIPSDATLYVPASTLAKYRALADWNRFTNIEESAPDFKDYDIFTAQTAEGVEMTFQVISAQNKTCQVGNGESTCIDRSTTGVVTIPETVKGLTVTIIGKGAFVDCTGLTSIAFPNSIISIEGGAFRGCTNLKKVIVSDIAAWCGISFKYVNTSNPLFYAHHLYSNETTEITDLIIPDGVTNISTGAFIGCSSLTSVSIPNSVTCIGGYAFRSCSGLTSVTSEIQEPFATGEEAFAEIPSDATLYVPAGTVAQYRALADWNRFTNITEIQDAGGYTKAELQAMLDAIGQRLDAIGSMINDAEAMYKNLSGNYNISDDVRAVVEKEWSRMSSYIDKYNEALKGYDVLKQQVQAMTGNDNGTLYNMIVALQTKIDQAENEVRVVIAEMLKTIEYYAAEDMENRMAEMARNINIILTNILPPQNDLNYIREQLGDYYFMRKGTDEFLARYEMAIARLDEAVAAANVANEYYKYLLDHHSITTIEDIVNFYTGYADLQNRINNINNAIYASYSEIEVLKYEFENLEVNFPDENLAYAIRPTELSNGPQIGYKQSLGFVLSSNGMMWFEQKSGADFYFRDADGHYIVATSDGTTQAGTKAEATVWTGLCDGKGNYTFTAFVNSRYLYLGCNGTNENSALTVSNTNYRWTITEFKQDQDHDYDWSIGSGGDFADVNSAMSDSRVKDGDVLQVLNGTILNGTTYITKAVTIKGNGYEDKSDGHIYGIYIDCEGVTIKNLHNGYIYVRANNATIERCRTSHISGRENYESDDVTIRGCLVLGYVCSYYNNISYGWKISNNIIIATNYWGNALDYLEEATIDHNLIINYEGEVYGLYAVGAVNNSSFTNNIFLRPTYSQGINDGVVNSATKFEYNIISNSGTFAKWPTNITGYNNMAKLFECSGERTTDTYYKLVAGSPALGYANDGGDCGPWSGAFPYLINGKESTTPEPDPTQWKLDPTLTTDTERYEFATLDALFNFMLSHWSWYKEGMTDVTVSVADATYTMDVIPNINTSSFSSVDEIIKYIYYKMAELCEIINGFDNACSGYNITFNLEAQHEAIFQFNLQNSQAYNAFLEFMAVKIVEMQAQGMTQEEIEARKAQWFAQIKEYMNRLYEAMQKFASHIKTTNIIIFLDNTRINPDPDSIEPNDLLALKNIYNMLGGSSWTNKKWKINDYGAKKEDFPGVTFDDEGYVVEINLENNNLRGSINPTGWTWQLCLPRLTGLYLQKNNISGDLSPWLKGVNRGDRLKALNMSYNNLTEISDSIPSSITSLNLENQNREWYRPDGVYTDPLKIEAMSDMTPIRLYLSANQTVVMPSLFTYNHKSQTHSARPTIYIINAEGIDKYGYFKSSGEDTYSLAWKDNEYTEKQNAPCYVRFDNPYGSVYPAYLRYIEGDANMSGYTDVLDVQTTLNYVLNGGGVWQFNRSAANTYEDNLINVQDIVCMVNIVLNNEAVAEGIILNTSSSRRHLRRAADAMDAQGWLYTEKGRVMLTTVNEVGAIDLELKGVSTSQVSLLLNHSQYQMIGRNTEEGSRYVIFSPTGQPIPASEEVALLAVSSQTELIGAQAADMEAQELELAIGQPTGLEAIDNGQLTNDNAPIYNVAGQRLSKMQRGINITNGRKVLK